MKSGVSYASVAAQATWNQLARTNKNTNYNANPTDLTGVSIVGGTPVLSVVNDAVELANAGLLDVCTNGNVIKIDNSAAGTTAIVFIGGVTGNINPHVISTYWRGSGNSTFGLNAASSTFLGSGASGPVPATYTRKIVGQVPSNTVRQTAFAVSAGAIVYFILNQLEERSYATTPVIVAGASASAPTPSTYPLANLADLSKPRTPTVWTGPGGLWFNFILPAAAPIRFIGLVHHNAPAGARMQVQLYGDNNPIPTNTSQLLYDSGEVSVWPSGKADLFVNGVRPLLLPSEVNAQSGLISMSPQAGDWEIGGVEIARWIGWEDTHVSREAGLQAKDQVVEVGDIEHAISAWSPRFITGSRELAVPADLDAWRDFQIDKKLNNPFVWCWDTDDASTWGRQCYLARNASIPPPMHREYGSGRINFDFEEHLR